MACLTRCDRPSSNMPPDSMTELTLETRLSAPAHVVSRAVDEETVLLNLESGLYFGVDKVGQRIWQLVGDGKTLDRVVDTIVAEYEVEPAQAEGDVLEFAGTLLEKGLLEKDRA